jgi:hypothetical protein
MFGFPSVFSLSNWAWLNACSPAKALPTVSKRLEASRNLRTTFSIALCPEISSLIVRRQGDQKIAPLASRLPIRLGWVAQPQTRHIGLFYPRCIHWVSSPPFMSVSMSGHDTLPFDVEQRCTSVANAASSMDKSWMRWRTSTSLCSAIVRAALHA